MRPRQSASRVDVAVYAPYAGALYEREPRATGGAELQSAHIARALARHGLRVRHVVRGDDLITDRDGVEVQAIDASYDRGGVARRRAALTALRAARARVYIQRSAGFETALVGVHARATRGRFVFSSSSVADFTRDPAVARNAGAGLEDRATRWQYLLGLRLAHAVVVQTAEQQRLAQSDRGVRSQVIPSFAELEPLEPGVPSRDMFLWAGGLIGSKDPLAYVELARRVPEARFVMVAGDRGAAWAPLAAETRAAAAAVPNLELVPPLAPAGLRALYRHAVAVVSTSRFEGFPNVFLEGWARGTPALSLRVDPDGVIAREGLGAACGGSIDRLAEAAADLWARRGAIDGAPFRAYVERRHAPAVVGAEWLRVVTEQLT